MKNLHLSLRDQLPCLKPQKNWTRQTFIYARRMKLAGYLYPMLTMFPCGTMDEVSVVMPSFSGRNLIMILLVDIEHTRHRPTAWPWQDQHYFVAHQIGSHMVNGF